MDLKILPLKEEDIKEILPYFKEWYKLFDEYSKNTIFYFIKGTNQEDLLKKLKEEWTILVAFSKSRPVGIIMANKPYGGVIYCDVLLVDENFQKKGIGSRLLEEFENISKRKGVHNIRVESEERDLPFYEKNGYEVVGLDKKGYWGTDNYILKKLIQEPKEENFLK